MNVIFIETDQLAAKWLGCYGNMAAHTPNLDRLAATGIRFDNCFANNPVCMPSRATTITGRSCQHHGVLYNGWELPGDSATFPKILQKNGVQTFGVGKFHLECHARGAFPDVMKYGFDRAENTEDTRAGEWLEWVREKHPDCYEAALSTCWPMEELREYGPEKIDLVEQIIAVSKENNYTQNPMTSPNNATGLAFTTCIPEKACQTTWITGRAIDFIDERDKSKPFFLKVSYVAPHDLYDPPARFLDLIDPDAIPAPLPGEGLLDMFMSLPFVRHKQYSADDWKFVRRHYFASIAFIDEQIGRLMEHLESSGLRENTAIIFSSDHGDMMGDHGFPAKGAWHYDGCIRIPLIINLPEQAEPHIETQAVSNLDMFQTVTGLFGIEHDVPVEGCDLTSDAWKKRPDAALVETYGSYGSTDPGLRARTVANGQFRYTCFGNGREMLYDLKNDPGECINLIDTADYQVELSKLRKMMLDLIATQYIPMPDRNRLPGAGH